METALIILGLFALVVILIIWLNKKTASSAKAKVKLKQAEARNETARYIAKINNARVADSVDIKRMLRNRRK